MSETQNPTAPTAARPAHKTGGGHYYNLDGTPCFEVPKKSGAPGEMRKTTLADCKKLGLLPSVTTILQTLDKPALNEWRIEQACLAIATTPRLLGEAEDAFVLRVLHTDKVQDEEAALARDKGIAIHEAIQSYFEGKPIPEEWAPYVNGPINAVLEHSDKASSEVVLVGDDYAGMCDLIQDCPDCYYVWDFKSAKNLPDPARGGAWDEHRLQLAAYAKAFQQRLVRAGRELKPIICANLYISTTNVGQYVICEHEGWEEAYELGFRSVVRIWQWLKGYRPVNPNAAPVDPVASAGSNEELLLLRANLQELGKLSEARGVELEGLKVELAKDQEALRQYRDGSIPIVPQESPVLQEIMNRLASIETKISQLRAIPPALQPVSQVHTAATPLPPAMARPQAKTGGAVPPKVVRPTPTLPSAIGGKRVMWDNGRPTNPGPASDPAPAPVLPPPPPAARQLNQAWDDQ